MRFISTSGDTPPTSLADALRLGPAPDGGLFVPERLEALSMDFFTRLSGRRWNDVACDLAEHLLSGDIPTDALRRLTRAALAFPVPLVRLDRNVYLLELFHGPTLAFKDVGARFLARLLAHTREPGDGVLTVMVATSGDTGGAVAQAFFGVPGTRVAILYPVGQVSPVQERQFTTLGGNVRAFGIEGSFDDCQRLVKQCFADRELHRELSLTSANSINIGRLLPQIFYYFQATAQLGEDPGEVLFVTPSGNFGNLTAGLMARALGLESRFVAATNANDVVPEYLETGIFSPRPSVRTLSNAMDVGDPSNVARILHLYDGDLETLKNHLRGHRVTDEETRETIREVDDRLGYVLDPHSAVGYHALRQLEPDPDDPAIILGTAHPAKFLEVVEPIVGRPLPLPAALAERLEAEIVAEPLAPDLGQLVDRLRGW